MTGISIIKSFANVKNHTNLIPINHLNLINQPAGRLVIYQTIPIHQIKIRFWGVIYPKRYEMRILHCKFV
ncbi:MAG: hypothetical protein JWO92_1090 [Chitinophagaceae bacterium]|nr:hypothetical protein [Chitinophagaceae bacterium]